MVIYIVKKNDTTDKIAKMYDVDEYLLITVNGIENLTLVPGQALAIPVNHYTHTVTKDDSLYSLARIYNISIDDILNANPDISQTSSLKVGQKIDIPMYSKKYASIDVGGTCFSNISATNLRKQAKMLTYLNIFCYSTDLNGNLSNSNDSRIVDISKEYSTVPMMTITNIDNNDKYNPDIVTSIVRNEDIANSLIENIMNVSSNKGHLGVNLNFEYINPYDKEYYNEFVKKMYYSLNENGIRFCASIPPKLGKNDRHNNVHAHDYDIYAKYTDHVILMAYDWGDPTDPNSCIAPIDKTIKAIEYAVSKIDSQKILLGVPNYAYSLSLDNDNNAPICVMNNTEAICKACDHCATIEYDNTVQAPYYKYTDDFDENFIVFFEDIRSINSKLALIEKYNLGGLNIFNINSYFPQFYFAIDSTYNPNKLL